MERLNRQALSLNALQNYREQLEWNLSRSLNAITRKISYYNWIIIALVLISSILLSLLLLQKHQIAQLKVKPVSAPPIHHAQNTNARDRLNLFNKNLLAHDDIPPTIKDILLRAEKNAITIKHGAYKAKIDEQGQFLRYQMIFPVSGKASAINEFVKDILLAHQSLALEGMQFKREQVDSAEITTKLQLVLLTKLPNTALSNRLVSPNTEKTN